MNKTLFHVLFFIPYISACAAPELSGYWVLDHGPVPGEIIYTDEGQAQKDSYDLLTDDPMLTCTPPSVGRVYSHPGTPFEMIQKEDSLVIRYELFDMTRTINFNAGDDAGYSTMDAHGTLHPTLGVSTARYEGDTLTVETGSYSPGIVFTSSGVPQGTATHTIEKYHKQDDRLYLTITYMDPELYPEGFNIDYEFRRYPEAALLEYGCTVENASYDD